MFVLTRQNWIYQKEKVNLSFIINLSFIHFSAAIGPPTLVFSRGHEFLVLTSDVITGKLSGNQYRQAKMLCNITLIERYRNMSNKPEMS